MLSGDIASLTPQKLREPTDAKRQVAGGSLQLGGLLLNMEGHGKLAVWREPKSGVGWFWRQETD